MGAALSYYAVFSIAPLLVIVIAVAGLVFGADAARGAIVGQLQGLLGYQAAQTIQEVLSNVSEPKKSAWATVIGIVLVLVGATTVFAELQDDLDRIWKVPQRARPQGAWSVVRARMLSFGMVLAIGFLLLVSLVASAAISAVGAWGGGVFADWEALAHVVEMVVSFALLTALFAVMYRYLPDVRITWHDVGVGAIATALLFTLGKLLIGLYIGRSSTASTFGAAGSLVVLLLWVYYSSQIFLFGAEFTAAYSHTYGSRRAYAAVERGAAPGVDPTQSIVAASTGSRPSRTDQPAAAPGQPASAGMNAASSSARAAAGAPARQSLVVPVARHPAGAIGVAAALGALAGLILYQRRRAQATPLRPARARGTAQARAMGPTRARRGHAAHGPTLRLVMAKAVASALTAIVMRALGARLKRGALRGWRQGTRRSI
jgi:membrane protein